jgi:hypothetical protein
MSSDAVEEEVQPYRPQRQQMEPEAAAAVQQWVDDWKYPTVPHGRGDERMVLLLNYLLPGLEHMLAVHFIQRGWRRNDSLATIKPRPIIGGVFPDLVAYVPVHEPSDPIVTPQDPTPNPDPALWSVKPTLTDTFEERPADD